MCLNMGVFLSLSLSSSDSAGVRPAAIEYKNQTDGCGRERIIAYVHKCQNMS